MWCLFFAALSLGLAMHKLAKPSMPKGLLGQEVCGEEVQGALGFLLPVLSPQVAALSQVFPPVPMKPIYSFHTRIRTKHLLLPSEEKPCPAYIAPLKGKWGLM